MRLEQERAIHDVVEELLVQLEREHEEHEQEIHDAVEELLIELLVQVEKEHEEHEQEKHDVVEELLVQEINGVAEEQNPAAIAEGKKDCGARSWLLPLLPPQMWSHPEPLPRALGPASFPDDLALKLLREFEGSEPCSLPQRHRPVTAQPATHGRHQLRSRVSSPVSSMTTRARVRASSSPQPMAFPVARRLAGFRSSGSLAGAGARGPAPEALGREPVTEWVRAASRVQSAQRDRGGGLGADLRGVAKTADRTDTEVSGGGAAAHEEAYWRRLSACPVHRCEAKNKREGVGRRTVAEARSSASS